MRRLEITCRGDCGWAGGGLAPQRARSVVARAGCWPGCRTVTHILDACEECCVRARQQRRIRRRGSPRLTWSRYLTRRSRPRQSRPQIPLPASRARNPWVAEVRVPAVQPGPGRTAAAGQRRPSRTAVRGPGPGIEDCPAVFDARGDTGVPLPSGRTGLLAQCWGAATWPRQREVRGRGTSSMPRASRAFGIQYSSPIKSETIQSPT